ncbi:MAG: hypothetical protein H0V75_12380 [Rubrobacter sp.]|nr:hypothetical protein [Rubrobacter sp.]
MKDVLSDVLREVRIGRAVSSGPLHIFPLVGGADPEEGLSLLDDALEEGSLVVEELESGGSIPELRVENKGEIPVLILEGDEFVGFKQNRRVNSSVLIAAASEFVLPVSCVEQGRWSRRSRPFSSGASSSHLSLRRIKSRSVHDSLKSGRGHRSDQSSVWEEIDRLSAHYDVASPTRSLQDARERLSERLSEFEALSENLPKDARGAIVSLGGRPVALEILAGPRVFAKVFGKLLSGYALEALEWKGSPGVPDPFSAGDLIEAALSAKQSEHPAVGAGRDLRLESEDVSGYALVEGGRVLHAAVFA